MRINIYSVANHLAEEHWQLVSTEYKNLDTELEMICPAGHRQFQTYGNWRKHMICDQCMVGDRFKIKKNYVPPKKVEVQRVLALDAATGTTGYSIYDDESLISYGTFKTDSAAEPTERIHEVKEWLLNALKEWEPDFVAIENIQLQKFGGGSTQMQVKTFQVLANLQGVLADTLFEQNVDFELVYAAEWRSYCGVNEGERNRENKKRLAQEKVKMWYDQDCTQDEADAICIGKYAAHSAKKSHWGEQI